MRPGVSSPWFPPGFISADVCQPQETLPSITFWLCSLFCYLFIFCSLILVISLFLRFVYLRILFFGCGGSCCCARAFSGCVERRLLSSVARGRPLQGPSLVWPTGSVTLQREGSSWTRDQAGVRCVARWVLNHSTPEEPMFTNSCTLIIFFLCLVFMLFLFWSLNVDIDLIFLF